MATPSHQANKRKRAEFMIKITYLNGEVKEYKSLRSADLFGANLEGVVK